MLLEEPGVDAARHLNPSGAKLGVLTVGRWRTLRVTRGRGSPLPGGPADGLRHQRPATIAAAITAEIGRTVDNRLVETDGATRAASLIAELV
jgi:hypothetical protein